MAESNEINFKLLSVSTGGAPILITGTSAAGPTVVHNHDASADHLDIVTLWLCNTHTSDLLVYVAIYTGSSATDPNSIAYVDTIPAQSGIALALDGAPVAVNYKVGVWCATGSKITATGKAPEWTL